MTEDKIEESKTEEKAEETSPKWAIELGAKIDRNTDAFERVAKLLSKQDEEEEKPVEEEPKEEEKQDEASEPTPEEQCKSKGGEWVDGECKMPEKPVEETKEDKVDITKLVEEAVKKILAEPSVKKSLVPKTVEQVIPSYQKIAKMSWAEFNKLAEKNGAPSRRS